MHTCVIHSTVPAHGQTASQQQMMSHDQTFDSTQIQQVMRERPRNRADSPDILVVATARCDSVELAASWTYFFAERHREKFTGVPHDGY